MLAPDGRGLRGRGRGPAHVTFQRRELLIDLNGDERAERVILLADQRRGSQLPRTPAEFAAGAIVDAFAVFDGRHPSVPVFYQYADDGGFALRIDGIDGQRVLVSDGGRDHLQHVWGWWTYPEAWPPAGWESRQRAFDQRAERWSEWKPRERIVVSVGK